MAQIHQLLRASEEQGLIGIEFMAEILGPPGDASIFYCFLCQRKMDSAGVIQCITSAQHRLEYLRRYFPGVSKKFEKVPNISMWKQPTYDFLSLVAERIEKDRGRLDPIVFDQGGEEEFNMQRGTIVQNILLGKHIREDSDLNFETLPDPFGSYLRELDPGEIVSTLDVIDKAHDITHHKPDAGLDHISDPEMQTLMQREIARFREAAAKQTPEGIKAVMTGAASMEEEDNERKIAQVRSILGAEEQAAYDSQRQKTSGEKSKTAEGPVVHALTNRVPISGGKTFGRRLPAAADPEFDPHKAANSSPTRNKGRSPRSRERRRSHSPSPFKKELDKWKKFKQAEKVMLNSVNRRRDIYDKRPEDHPSYPEEWRLFWEKRFKELQAQGRDTESHDFKSEWIPFWGKRVNALFEEEVHEKTADLLRQFNLTSADEPKRDDFKQEHREQRKGRSKERRRHSRSRSSSRSERERRRPRRSTSRERGSFGSDAYSGATALEERRDRVPSPSGGRRGMGGGDGGYRLPNFPASPPRGSYRGDYPGSPPRGYRFGYPPSPGRDGYRGHGGCPRTSRSRSPPMRSSARGNPFERSPLHQARNYFDRSPPRASHMVEFDGLVMVLPSLRQLSALEDILGSLGPQVNLIMGRALNLEQARRGSSNVLLADPDVACIMEMVKEKLSAQMMAGLLQDTKEGAVRVALDHLTRLLRASTKKRPLQPPKLLAPPDEKTKLKQKVAGMIANILIQKGMSDLDDYDVKTLIFKIVEDTDLEGTIAPVHRPPPPEPFVQQRSEMASSSAFIGGSRGVESGSSPLVASAKESFQGLASAPMSMQQAISGGDGLDRFGAKLSGESSRVGEGGDGLDEFDDLTPEELRSLLDNFKNLSKSEQKDLIQYMRKLEKTNPLKVRMLKSKGGSGGAISQDRRSLSPFQQRSFHDDTFSTVQNPGSDYSGRGGREDERWTSQERRFEDYSGNQYPHQGAQQRHMRPFGNWDG